VIIVADGATHSERMVWGYGCSLKDYSAETFASCMALSWFWGLVFSQYLRPQQSRPSREALSGVLCWRCFHLLIPTSDKPLLSYFPSFFCFPGGALLCSAGHKTSFPNPRWFVYPAFLAYDYGLYPPYKRKEKKWKDSAGSGDTASMIKGGGYLGARTRQTIKKKLMWVRGLCAVAPGPNPWLLLLVLYCSAYLVECRCMSDGVFVEFVCQI